MRRPGGSCLVQPPTSSAAGTLRCLVPAAGAAAVTERRQTGQQVIGTTLAWRVERALS
jgi:hypothetical protein